MSTVYLESLQSALGYITSIGKVQVSTPVSLNAVFVLYPYAEQRLQTLQGIVQAR